METIIVKRQHCKRSARNTGTIQTTLYDLMETVIDVVGPDEYKLINEVTLNILKMSESSGKER
jgi:hypothetical protein